MLGNKGHFRGFFLRLFFRLFRQVYPTPFYLGKPVLWRINPAISVSQALPIFLVLGRGEVTDFGMSLRIEVIFVDPFLNISPPPLFYELSMQERRSSFAGFVVPAANSSISNKKAAYARKMRSIPFLFLINRLESHERG